VSESMAGLKRTHYCGELTTANDGQEVTLMGWVHRRRDHGGLIFVDLRDRSGLAQIVFSPEVSGLYFAKAEAVRGEYVLAVRGRVGKRPEGTVNLNLTTGQIEVYASELRILNPAKTPPFYIEDNVDVDETLRLKYRYLDLRRPEMQKALILRHKTTMAIREFLDQRGFLEIETPMLTKSSPEGARDYLVPSRVHPGKFFALPQSPQIFKQILMVAGMDKYFQIVRCFRDEDLRADRQPEFTQLDIEMSFAGREDILVLMEQMVAFVFEKVLDRHISTPFPRITYEEAIDKYGSDKPDLRFGIPLVDISDIAAAADFKVFSSTVHSGGQVKGINATGCGRYTRKELDDLTNYIGVFGAKGLAWMIVTEDGVKSPIAKFFHKEQIDHILTRMDAGEGDLLLFVADKPPVVADSLGHLRLEIGKREKLVDPHEFNFSWVIDFPLLEYDEEEKRWVAIHHPFTSPKEEDLELLTAEPGKVRAQAYDMVLNGIELGGGSIRIHRRQIQEQMFKLLGLSQEEAEEKFGYLLEAFEYGTPPHGGIAFGIDRMVMLMNQRDTIRDVIAFPKTQSAADLMSQSPSTVSEKQLRELYIRLNTSPQKQLR